MSKMLITFDIFQGMVVENLSDKFYESMFLNMEFEGKQKKLSFTRYGRNGTVGKFTLFENNALKKYEEVVKSKGQKYSNLITSHSHVINIDKGAWAKDGSPGFCENLIKTELRKMYSDIRTYERFRDRYNVSGFRDQNFYDASNLLSEKIAEMFDLYNASSVKPTQSISISTKSTSRGLFA